jgi:hypothetical protein
MQFERVGSTGAVRTDEAVGMGIDWTDQLLDQLHGHWTHQLRPRLDGLTDEEYFWEPVPACWNIRPRSQLTPAIAMGSGAFTLDIVRPGPSPAPVTTISWRLAHLIVSVLGMRLAGHFGGPVVSYEEFAYAGTAVEALGQLDETYAAWIAGVRGLDAAGLARPCGPAEGQYAEHPVATLVLHINREIIHHGAEIALLRDLYQHRQH